MDPTISRVGRRALAVGALLAAAGCGDAAAPPPPALRAFPAAGDAQRAPIRTLLPSPLQVGVEDELGRPAAGVPIVWGSGANGRIEPIDHRTSQAGRAAARFELGDRVGPAEAYALVLGDSIAFRLEAISVAGPPLPDYDAVVPLGFPTFDASGEVVHPDHALTPALGFAEHLAITPYPGGNPSFERPSLFGARSWSDWLVPLGAPNPLVPNPPIGHLSDPDIVHRPDARDLWLFYRQVDTRNRVLLIRSTDGVHWDAPREVVSAPNHELLSPSVVYRGPGDWMMWSVNGGALGCGGADAWLERRRSSDGVAWSAPERIALAHDRLFPWHVDVQWIPERAEYWALYNAKEPGSCATPALFLATSSDGVAWRPIRRPVMVKGATSDFEHIVYRSSFRYDHPTGDVWLWLSGARYASNRWIWRAAVQRRRADDLLATTRLSVPLLFDPPPAELVDWP